MEKNKHLHTGKIGESLAENFLASQNFLILEKNFHCREGEIDLIAVDRDGTVVFVEVKTRTNDLFGEPIDAINYFKRKKILKAAIKFLNRASENKFINWRIDAICVQLDKKLKLKNIEHFKNIFDGFGR